MTQSSDSGLQYERTLLSWHRTFLSCIILVSYLARLFITTYNYIFVFILFTLTIHLLSNSYLSIKFSQSSFWRLNSMLALVTIISVITIMKTMKIILLK
ncbi:DUF202 domain-containing protein [Edwardsiella anguillarum]|uniref:DUF202 domain-containing protein n=1 Tax=Edwardsiella anguillarum TaxID=1821960 RepID=UPI003D1FC195